MLWLISLLEEAGLTVTPFCLKNSCRQSFVIPCGFDLRVIRLNATYGSKSSCWDSVCRLSSIRRSLDAIIIMKLHRCSSFCFLARSRESIGVVGRKALTDNYKKFLNSEILTDQISSKNQNPNLNLKKKNEHFV